VKLIGSIEEKAMKKILAGLALVVVSYVAMSYNVEIKITENSSFACNPKEDPGCD
jgi:hypothetical protein